MTRKIPPVAPEPYTLQREYQHLQALHRLESAGSTPVEGAGALEALLLDELVDGKAVEVRKRRRMLLFSDSVYALTDNGTARLEGERADTALRARIPVADDAAYDLALRALILDGEFDGYAAERFLSYLRSPSRDIAQRVRKRKRIERVRDDNGTSTIEPLDDLFDMLILMNYSYEPPSFSPSPMMEGAGGDFGGAGASAFYDAPADLTMPLPDAAPDMVPDGLVDTADSVAEASGGILDTIGDIASSIGDVISDIDIDLD